LATPQTSSLEEHGATAVERLPAQPRRVGDVGLEAVAVGEVLLRHRVQVDRRVLRERAQQLRLGLERRGDLLAQDLGVEEVLDPDPQPRRLVGVAGADPAPRGADLELSELLLARRVEQHVVGHDHVRVGGDAQPADVDAAPLEALQLVREDAGVDHHPVSDHAGLAGIEDPRRDEVELELVAVADDRVAGVVATLEAHDGVRPLGEQVGHLSLALVAPLGADNHYSGHDEGIMERSEGVVGAAAP
jgi:hypothetical protein